VRELLLALTVAKINFNKAASDESTGDQDDGNDKITKNQPFAARVSPVNVAASLEGR